MTGEPRPRKYELKRRAQRQAETRQRIVTAAVELHRVFGPARTQVTAIAERAGVGRVTVYRHFPNEQDLLRACAGHNLGRNPLPDPTGWLKISQPEVRLRTALSEAYTYYGRNEEIMASVLRDSQIMAVGQGFLKFQAAAKDVLSQGWKVPGRQRVRLSALIGLAVDFHTWRLLRQSGLDDAEVVALMVKLTGCV